MPKKIKKEKKTTFKSNKENIINTNNIYYIFVAVAILVICICTFVGVYVYKEDKYHVHKDNAIVLFEYTEALDEGYNVFSVTQTEGKRIFTEYNTLDVQNVKEISRGKYLDFNEEIYNSGILEYMSDESSIVTDTNWSLYIKFADGTKKYLYSAAINQENKEVDKSLLADIIKKYFNQEILYKLNLYWRKELIVLEDILISKGFFEL